MGGTCVDGRGLCVDGRGLCVCCRPLRQGLLFLRNNLRQDAATKGQQRCPTPVTWAPHPVVPPLMVGRGCSLGCSGLGEAARTPHFSCVLRSVGRPLAASSCRAVSMARVPASALSSLKSPSSSSCLLVALVLCKVCDALSTLWEAEQESAMG